jgi:hypothetical protein
MTTVEVQTGIGFLVVSPLNISWFSDWNVLSIASPLLANGVYQASPLDVAALLRFIPFVHEALLPAQPSLTRAELEAGLTLAELYALRLALNEVMNYRMDGTAPVAATESEVEQCWVM